MEEFNKFKVLTVAIILMFIFAVAAIYTNTKEASAGKADNKRVEESTEMESRQNYEAQESSNGANIDELYDRVDKIGERIAEISDKVNSYQNSTCHIYGIMTDNGPEQYSAREALDKAQENGLDVVLSCRF